MQRDFPAVLFKYQLGGLYFLSASRWCLNHTLKWPELEWNPYCIASFCSFPCVPIFYPLLPPCWRLCNFCFLCLDRSSFYPQILQVLSSNLKVLTAHPCRVTTPSQNIPHSQLYPISIPNSSFIAIPHSSNNHTFICYFGYCLCLQLDTNSQ